MANLCTVDINRYLEAQKLVKKVISDLTRQKRKSNSGILSYNEAKAEYVDRMIKFQLASGLSVKDALEMTIKYSVSFGLMVNSLSNRVESSKTIIDFFNNNKGDIYGDLLNNRTSLLTPIQKTKQFVVDRYKSNYDNLTEDERRQADSALVNKYIDFDIAASVNICSRLQKKLDSIRKGSVVRFKSPSGVTRVGRVYGMPLIGEYPKIEVSVDNTIVTVPVARLSNVYLTEKNLTEYFDLQLELNDLSEKKQEEQTRLEDLRDAMTMDTGQAYADPQSVGYTEQQVNEVLDIAAAVRFKDFIKRGQNGTLDENEKLAIRPDGTLPDWDYLKNKVCKNNKNAYKKFFKSEQNPHNRVENSDYYFGRDRMDNLLKNGPEKDLLKLSDDYLKTLNKEEASLLKQIKKYDDDEVFSNMMNKFKLENPNFDIYNFYNQQENQKAILEFDNSHNYEQESDLYYGRTPYTVYQQNLGCFRDVEQEVDSNGTLLRQREFKIKRRVLSEIKSGVKTYKLRLGVQSRDASVNDTQLFDEINRELGIEPGKHNAMYGVLADDSGNILYFDENGNETSKSEGKPAYYHMQAPQIFFAQSIINKSVDGLKKVNLSQMGEEYLAKYVEEYINNNPTVSAQEAMDSFYKDFIYPAQQLYQNVWQESNNGTYNTFLYIIGGHEGSIIEKRTYHEGVDLEQLSPKLRTKLKKSIGEHYNSVSYDRYLDTSWQIEGYDVFMAPLEDFKSGMYEHKGMRYKDKKVSDGVKKMILDFQSPSNSSNILDRANEIKSILGNIIFINAGKTYKNTADHKLQDINDIDGTLRDRNRKSYINFEPVTINEVEGVRLQLRLKDGASYTNFFYNFTKKQWQYYDGNTLQDSYNDKSAKEYLEECLNTAFNVKRNNHNNNDERAWNVIKFNQNFTPSEKIILPTVENGNVVFDEVDYYKYFFSIECGNRLSISRDCISNGELKKINPHFILSSKRNVIKDEGVTEYSGNAGQPAVTDIESVIVNQEQNTNTVTQNEVKLNDDEEVELPKDIFYSISEFSSYASDEDNKKAKEWFDKSPIKDLYEYRDFRDKINERGKNYIASWTKDAITLYKGSSYADLYHEAWHGFTQGMLTKSEKKKLYDEVRKYSGKFKTHNGRIVSFNEATDTEIEEYLADNFKDYAQNGGEFLNIEKNKGEKKEGFFKRIWNFLKNLFGKHTSKQLDEIYDNPLSNEFVQELYDNLYNHNLNQYTFSRDNFVSNELYSVIKAINADDLFTYDENVNIRQICDALTAEFYDGLNDGCKISVRSNGQVLGEKLVYNFSDIKTLAKINRLNGGIRQMVNSAVNTIRQKGEKTTVKTLTESIKKQFEDESISVTEEELSNIVNYIKKDSSSSRIKPIEPITPNNISVDNLKLSFEYIRQRLGELLKTPGISEKKREMLNKALRNFGNVDSAEFSEGKGVIADYIKTSPIYSKIDVDKAIEENDKLQEEGFAMSTDSTFDKSLKEMMTDDIKYIINTIPLYDSEGNVQRDELGNIKFQSEKYFINRLGRTLNDPVDEQYWETHDKQDAYEIFMYNLQKLAKQDYHISRLVDRMGNPKSENNIVQTRWTNLFQAFNKFKIDFVTLQYKINKEETEKEIAETGNNQAVVHDTIVSRAMTSVRNIHNKWINEWTALKRNGKDGKLNEFLEYSKAGTLVYNAIAIEKEFVDNIDTNKYPIRKYSFESFIFSGIKHTNLSFQTKEEVGNDDLLRNNVINIVELLNKLGMKVPQNVHVYNELVQNWNTYRLPISSILQNIIGTVKSKLEKNSIYSEEELENAKFAYDHEEYSEHDINLFAKRDLDLKYNFLSKAVSLKQLARLEGNNIAKLEELTARFSDEGNSFMITTADGNTAYEHIKNNEYTVIVRMLNNCYTYGQVLQSEQLKRRFDIRKFVKDEDGRLVPNINYNPFIDGTGIIQKMFEIKDGEDFENAKRRKITDTYNSHKTSTTDYGYVRLKLEMINGVVTDVDSNTGSTTYGADPYTRFIQAIEMSQGGIVELPRTADKPSCYALKLIETPNENECRLLETDFHASSLSKEAIFADYLTDKNKVSKEIANKMISIVKSECYRIAKNNFLLNSQNTIAKDYSYLKKTSSFIISKAFVKQEILDDIYKKLNPNKEGGDLKITDEETLSNVYKSINQIFDDDTLRGQIKESVDEYFYGSKNKLGVIDAMHLKYKSFKSFLSINSQTLKSYNQNKKTLKLEEQEKLAIAQYVFNFTLTNFDNYIIFYGDPACLTLMDINKRNFGGNSSGDIFRTDSDFCDYINGTVHQTSYAASLYRDMQKNVDERVHHFEGFDPVSVLGTQDNSVYGPVMNSAIITEDTRKSIYVDHFSKYVPEIATGKPYNSMNVSDAQGYITFDAYRNFRIAEGKWDWNVQERVFQDIVNGVEVKNADRFFPPLKYQYFGPIDNEGNTENQMHKYSLQAIIPSVHKGTKLELLHLRMIREGITYVTYTSGSKTNQVYSDHTQGVKKKGDVIYKEGTTEIDIDKFSGNKDVFTKNKIVVDYLKDQVGVHDHMTESILFPTQMRALLDSFGMDNAKPVDYKGKKDWSKLTEEQRIDASSIYRKLRKYEKDFYLWQNINRKRVLDQLGITALDPETGEVIEYPELNQDVLYFTPDFGKLKKIIIRELSKDGSITDENINFLDSIGDNTKTSLSFHSKRIEDIIQGLVNRNMIKSRIHGEGMVQSASALLTKLRTEHPEGAFVNPSEEDILIYGNGDLPFYNRVGLDEFDKKGNLKKKSTAPTRAMKVKTSLSGEFKKLLNLTYKVKEGDNIIEKRIETREKLNELIKDEEWLNEDNHRKLISMCAVRIPTQSNNSMEFMEVYEFLPEEAGNIIIPPLEIVAKSGSDFDIDKMFIITPTYSYINGKLDMLSRNGNSFNEAKNALEIAQQEFDEVLNEIRSIDGIESVQDLKNLIETMAESNSAMYNELKSIQEQVKQTIKEELKAMTKDERKLSSDKLELMLDDIVKSETRDKNELYDPSIKELSVYYPKTKEVVKLTDLSKFTIGNLINYRRDYKQIIETLNLNQETIEKNNTTIKLQQFKEQNENNKQNKKKKEKTIDTAKLIEQNKKLIEENKSLIEKLKGLNFTSSEIYAYFSLIHQKELYNTVADKVREKITFKDQFSGQERNATRDEIQQVIESISSSKSNKEALIDLRDRYYSSKEKLANAKKVTGTEGIQNDILGDVISILSDPFMFESLITPNDTSIFTEQNVETSEGKKSYVDIFQKGNLGVVTSDIENNEVFAAFNPLYDFLKFYSNTQGKKCLEILAVENVSDSIMIRSGVKLNKFYINGVGSISSDEYSSDVFNPNSTNHTLWKMTALRINNILLKTGDTDFVSLCKRKNISGEDLQNIISQEINGAVDVAKGDWITKLNINPVTVSVLSHLLVSGVSVKDALCFINQPIIRKYAAAKMYENSVICKNITNPMQFNLAKIHILEECQNTIKDYILDYIPKELYPIYFNKTYGIEPGKLLEAANFVLYNEHSHDKKFEFPNDLSNEEFKSVIDEPFEYADVDDTEQVKYFLHYLQLEDTVRNTTQLKLLTKQDTNSQIDNNINKDRERRLNEIKESYCFQEGCVDRIKQETVRSGYFIQSLRDHIEKDLIGDEELFSDWLSKCSFNNETLKNIYKTDDISEAKSRFIRDTRGRMYDFYYTSKILELEKNEFYEKTFTYVKENCGNSNFDSDFQKYKQEFLNRNFQYRRKISNGHFELNQINLYSTFQLESMSKEELDYLSDRYAISKIAYKSEKLYNEINKYSILNDPHATEIEGLKLDKKSLELGRVGSSYDWYSILKEDENENDYNEDFEKPSDAYISLLAAKKALGETSSFSGMMYGECSYANKFDRIKLYFPCLLNEPLIAALEKVEMPDGGSILRYLDTEVDKQALYYNLLKLRDYDYVYEKLESDQELKDVSKEGLEFLTREINTFFDNFENFAMLSEGYSGNYDNRAKLINILDNKNVALIVQAGIESLEKKGYSKENILGGVLNNIYENYYKTKTPDERTCKHVKNKIDIDFVPTLKNEQIEELFNDKNKIIFACSAFVPNKSLFENEENNKILNIDSSKERVIISSGVGGKIKDASFILTNEQINEARQVITEIDRIYFGNSSVKSKNNMYDIYFAIKNSDTVVMNVDTTTKGNAKLLYNKNQIHHTPVSNEDLFVYAMALHLKKPVIIHTTEMHDKNISKVQDETNANISIPQGNIFVYSDPNFVRENFEYDDYLDSSLTDEVYENEQYLKNRYGLKMHEFISDTKNPYIKGLLKFSNKSIISSYYDKSLEFIKENNKDRLSENYNSDDVVSVLFDMYDSDEDYDTATNRYQDAILKVVNALEKSAKVLTYSQAYLSKNNEDIKRRGDDMLVRSLFERGYRPIHISAYINNIEVPMTLWEKVKKISDEEIENQIKENSNLTEKDKEKLDGYRTYHADNGKFPTEGKNVIKNAKGDSKFSSKSDGDIDFYNAVRKGETNAFVKLMSENTYTYFDSLKIGDLIRIPSEGNEDIIAKVVMKSHIDKYNIDEWNTAKIKNPASGIRYNIKNDVIEEFRTKIQNDEERGLLQICFVPVALYNSDTEDIYYYKEKDKSSETKSTININYGKNEHPELSNFAIRPFTHTFKNGRQVKFESVEQAFQYTKAILFGDNNTAEKILKTTDSKEIQKLGRSVNNYNDGQWNQYKTNFIKVYIKESFEQNEEAKQNLLSTGNAELTHEGNNLGNSKWKEEFPRILMEVRSELSNKNEGSLSFYDGDIVPDTDTIFVFGSNPEGKHSSGAAKVAKEQFGAIYGQGEGLQGNSYAIPTKDLQKAKSTRWYRPGKKEETEVKEWYKSHSISEVYDHPLNNERTISPSSIIESIKKLYEVARQNPTKQFKVSNYPIGQLSLNGYLGEEMIQMFKDAGEIPSNIIFSKEWINTGMFNDSQRKISQSVDVLKIADKTATYGVVIDTRLKNYTDENTKAIAEQWLKNNPNGIVAFRLAKNYNTPEMVNSGKIGNPYNWNVYGEGRAGQLFYNWLTTGDNKENEPLATEEFRLAIINKILNTQNPNILYYKELNRPSHATILGYLIKNKHLLQNATTRNSNAIIDINSLGLKSEITDIKTVTLHSGGAVGSDSQWDTIGREYGLQEAKHYWVEKPMIDDLKKNTPNPPKANTYISQEDYDEGRSEAAKAAAYNYGYSYNTMRDPLLIRDWSQVKHSDAVFAIGKFLNPGDRFKSGDSRIIKNKCVSGGTGYAVTMAILHGKPVYVFDQTQEKWFTYNGNDWVECDTPVLTKNFAGIGTREINSAGMKAIHDVYKKSLGINDSAENKTSNYELMFKPLDMSVYKTQRTVKSLTDSREYHVNNLTNGIEFEDEFKEKISQLKDGKIDPEFVRLLAAYRVKYDKAILVKDKANNIQYVITRENGKRSICINVTEGKILGRYDEMDSEFKTKINSLISDNVPHAIPLENKPSSDIFDNNDINNNCGSSNSGTQLSLDLE